MIDNGLLITEDLVIILPVFLSMTLTICCTLLYVFDLTGLSKHVDPDETPHLSGSTMFATHPAILDTTLGSSTCSNFRLSMARS